MTRIYIGPKPPFGVAPPKTDGPPPTPEETVEIAALLEAIAAFQNAKHPSGRQLSRIAVQLRKNPKLRRHPAMDPFLDAILDRFVAKYPPLAPGSVAAGALVEWWASGKNALTPPEARRQVADLLKMSGSTLREAIRVFRSKYRKASGK